MTTIQILDWLALYAVVVAIILIWGLYHIVTGKFAPGKAAFEIITALIATAVLCVLCCLMWYMLCVLPTTNH